MVIYLLKETIARPLISPEKLEINMYNMMEFINHIWDNRTNDELMPLEGLYTQFSTEFKKNVYEIF